MNKSILIIFTVILFSGKLYAQEELNIESGRKYKFVLFDDTEIIGKVLSVDEKFVKIQTKYKGVITVPRENILFVSTDLTPEKYDFSLALTGGVSFLNAGRHYYYSRNTQSGPHFNAGAMFYLSSTKAVKVDLSLSFSKPKFDDYYNYYNDPPEPDKFEGGESVYISFKPSFVMGQLEPGKKVIAYGTVGLGINYFSDKDITHTYYYKNYPDTFYTKRTEIIKGRNDVGVVLGVGGGLGFRITSKLSILTEAEFNVLGLRDNFETYIPLRIGINYFIY